MREPSMRDRLTCRPSSWFNSARRCLVIAISPSRERLSRPDRYPRRRGHWAVRPLLPTYGRRDAGAEAAGDLGRHHGPAQEEALQVVAAVGHEAVVGGDVLHTFGDDQHAETVGQLDHGPDDGGIALVVEHVHHEGLVDLDL